MLAGVYSAHYLWAEGFQCSSGTDDKVGAVVTSMHSMCAGTCTSSCPPLTVRNAAVRRLPVDCSCVASISTGKSKTALNYVSTRYVKQPSMKSYYKVPRRKALCHCFSITATKSKLYRGQGTDSISSRVCTLLPLATPQS